MPERLRHQFQKVLKFQIVLDKAEIYLTLFFISIITLSKLDMILFLHTAT